MTTMALLQAVLLIGAYALAKLLGRRNFLPALRDAMDIVGARYVGWNNDNRNTIN